MRKQVWGTAALLALCAVLLLGLWADRRQAALADDIIRLHVIAASDTPADQAEKLRVRDALLAALSPRLRGIRSAREAEALLRRALPEIESIAGAVSGRAVRAELGGEYYPTREYASFALPAGTYTSLRVTLGEGRGHNWWCVVYPPLCAAAAEDAVETAALREDDVKLITGQDRTYVLKFRVIEWWEALKHRGEAGEEEDGAGRATSG